MLTSNNTWESPEYEHVVSPYARMQSVRNEAARFFNERGSVRVGRRRCVIAEYNNVNNVDGTQLHFIVKVECEPVFLKPKHFTGGIEVVYFTPDQSEVSTILGWHGQDFAFSPHGENLFYAWPDIDPERIQHECNQVLPALGYFRKP